MRILAQYQWACHEGTLVSLFWPAGYQEDLPPVPKGGWAELRGGSGANDSLIALILIQYIF